MQTIRCVARGEVLLTQRQLIRAARWRAEVGERRKHLTEPERRVLQLLMQGLNNAAIAEELGVTTKAVERHVTRILRRLAVTSRLQAAV